ncbi:hypothetical protein SVIOM74S_02626 [Streptomyces violarus]
MAVTDEAIEKIKGMIVSGALRPGDRLPKESELAADLGLSRNSLREAVALSLIRILDVRQGDGTYVTSLDPHLLLEAISSSWTSTATTRSWSSWRYAASWSRPRRLWRPCASASNWTPDGPARQARRRPCRGGPVACASWSSTGASCRVRATPCCARCSTGCRGPTTRARIWRGLTQEDAVGRTLREHRAILAALRDPDAEAARSWAMVHIASVEQWLRSTLPPGPHGQLGRIRVFRAGSRGSDGFTPPARGLRAPPPHAGRPGGTRGHVGRRRWVIELEGFELIDPVMVAAFEGWNDAGDAASTAVAHLDREWKGEVFVRWTPRTTTTSR